MLNEKDKCSSGVKLCDPNHDVWARTSHYMPLCFMHNMEKIIVPTTESVCEDQKSWYIKTLSKAFVIC